MTSSAHMERFRLDELDQRIVGALQCDGRATWGRIAEVLGEAERTVARRASRLLDAHVLRIVPLVQFQRLGLGDPVLMTIDCSPGAITRVAGELAQLAHVRSVEILASSNTLLAEVVCSDEQLLAIIVDLLPRIEGIEHHQLHSILRYFRTPDEWRSGALTRTELNALSGDAPSSRIEIVADTEPLLVEDEGILDLLRLDCRMSYAEIARKLDLSISTARRRVESLRKRGLLILRAEIEPSLLGTGMEAVVWSKCDPSKIEEAGRSLAANDSTLYVAATTGAFQLVAIVAVPNKAGLYELLTDQIGAVPGIYEVKISPSLRSFKRGFVQREGHVLTSEPPTIAELRALPTLEVAQIAQG